jgi:hypothetical protein
MSHVKSFIRVILSYLGYKIVNLGTYNAKLGCIKKLEKDVGLLQSEIASVLSERVRLQEEVENQKIKLKEAEIKSIKDDDVSFRISTQGLFSSSVCEELRMNLYGGVNPYSVAAYGYLDANYPHTNIRPDLVRQIIRKYRPKFWLELGSFVGGSAKIVSKVAKEEAVDTSIVCCDPFSGDVNMWDWERESQVEGGDGKPYRFLNLEMGLPTIYKRFLANMFFSGGAVNAIPIQATSVVAIRLIKRLSEQGRISSLPNVIYLDSAHEPDETYLELKYSWDILPKHGVLMGDDWAWDSVRNDVIKFASMITKNREELQELSSELDGSTISDDGILLYEGQWLLVKS